MYTCHVWQNWCLHCYSWYISLLWEHQAQLRQCFHCDPAKQSHDEKIISSMIDSPMRGLRFKLLPSEIGYNICYHIRSQSDVKGKTSCDLHRVSLALTFKRQSKECRLNVHDPFKRLKHLLQPWFNALLKVLRSFHVAKKRINESLLRCSLQCKINLTFPLMIGAEGLWKVVWTW